MSQKVDWKERLKEMQNANPQDDSLELGDSWDGLPRPKEVNVNKTKAIYRRSALPQPLKNVYNIIIEKEPKSPNTTGGRKTINSSEAVASIPKTLIPAVAAIDPLSADECDTMNFSNYLHSKDNGTSTPYPVRRQNDRNISPNRLTVQIQKQAADSPNRNHIQVATVIPISTTPLTSREQNNRNVGHSKSHKQQLIMNAKSSSPVVSSTVDSNENGDVQLISPESEGVHTLQPVPVIKNENDLFEDQQERDVLTQDDVLFLRPQIVPLPSQKQNKLEKLIEPHPDQSEVPTQPNNSRRVKKSERKVDDLLESYRKVGESISNKTNSTQSQNFSSSTSSRRKLYRKGDSCTEDHDDVNNPSNEGSCETNTMQHEAPVTRSVQSNEAKSGTESGATVSDRNNDKSIRSVQRTTESQRAEILQKSGSVQIQQDDVEDPLICGDDAELVTQPENQVNSHTNKLQNQHTHSSNDQHENIEDDAFNASSKGQSTSQKSNKQALADIVEDWSDSSTVGTSKKADDNENHCSDSNDLEPPLHVINQKQPSKESSVRQVRSKNENVNVSPSKNKGSRHGRSKAHVQGNDSEEEEGVVLIDDMPPSNKAQGRRGHSKKKPINTKNGRENDSEEGDVVVMDRNNEEKTSKPGSQPSEKPEKPEKQHVRSRQPINTKNVRENDSDEDDDILMENVEVVPSSKKSENQHVRSKQPINTKNVQNNSEDDDEVLVNNVDVPPSRKIRGRQGRSKKQPPNNTKNVRENESKKANGVLINENTEDNVPPSKKTESSSGRPNRKNATTNKAGANDSDEDDNLLINNNEEKAVPPLKQPKRQHGRSNKQPTTKKKAREIDSLDDGELSINENDEQEDEPPLKKTRSKQQNNVVDVPPTKKTGIVHNRSKKQPILEESDRENGSDVEDVLLTSSICFDPSRMRLADSDSEEAIGKKKPSSKSKTLSINLIDDEDPIDEREEEVAKRPKSKEHRSKNQRVNNVEKKGQQSKKPQTRKRHLDNEDEPKNTQSNAKKKRLNVEETNDPDQLENEIDESPAEENTGKKGKRNQPTQPRLPNRQLDTEEVSSTTEQNDDQLSQNSGSKTSMLKKPKQKKSKWDAVPTNTRYFPLKEREIEPGTRHSTREKRLPESNLLLFAPISKVRPLASRNAQKIEPAPKRRRHESFENDSIYSMLLKGIEESVPPLVTNFHGIEISNGFHTTIKENMAIHHMAGESGPSYGYLILEPGALKRTCRISLKLRVHVVFGAAIIIIDEDSKTLATGSFVSLPVGTKYSLRNDGENQALIFFHQHVSEILSETPENDDLSENLSVTSDHSA